MPFQGCKMEIKAPAKVNIFLKITGFQGGYHKIASRFILYPSLYDTIAFTPKKSDGFSIEGMDLAIEQNIITKAYNLIKNEKTENFFKNHIVKITKRIPSQAGLGGGSSDAAAFLKLLNSICNLGYSLNQLAKIGAKVGADVPFFVYGYKSANVEGIGEIITPFEEELPNLELTTPSFGCDTAKVYQTFRKSQKNLEIKTTQKMLTLSSKEILKHFTPLQANDLYTPAITLCPQLKKYSHNYYLSGSGSTIFKERR